MGNGLHQEAAVKKRAARVTTSSDYSIRSHQIFEAIQWQPIKTIIRQQPRHNVVRTKHVAHEPPGRVIS